MGTEIFSEESILKEKNELTPMEKLQDSKLILLGVTFAFCIVVGLSSLIAASTEGKVEDINIFIGFNIIMTSILSVAWFFHLCKYVDLFIPIKLDASPRSNAINIVTKAILLVVFIGITFFICYEWHNWGESIKEEITSNRYYRS